MNTTKQEMSMSEVTDLTVIEIKPEQAPALYVANGLDAYLEIIREMAKEVPDVTTKKGRDRIGSLARAVGSSKKAIENPGRAYLKKLKEAVKPAEAELRRFVDECDDISKSILKPRVEWEVEQERIKQEEEAKRAAEELAKTVEAHHEIALLMNEKFDRDVAEARAEAERQRIDHEEELKRHAAEQAKGEAEAKAQRERDEAARREAELKLKAEQAERDRVAAEQKAAADAKAAAERAEREKQEAIAEANRKAQEEADRVRREAEEKEAARLAEERRVADEKARREADIEHRRTINRQSVAELVAAGLSEDCAQKCVAAIAKGEVTAIRITY
jgi:hypothetical protein